MTNISLHCLTGDYDNVTLDDPFNDGISLDFGIPGNNLNIQDIIFPIQILTSLQIMLNPNQPRRLDKDNLKSYNKYVYYIFLPLLQSYPELESLMNEEEWNNKTYICSSDFLLNAKEVGGESLNVDQFVEDCISRIDQNLSWLPGASMQSILMDQNLLESYVKETDKYRKLAIWLVAYMKYTGRINLLK